MYTKTGYNALINSPNVVGETENTTLLLLFSSSGITIIDIEY